MSILEAIFLGILQGATEFLPISSSGHLVLAPRMFNLTQPSLTVIAIAHVGTLLAVLIYFSRDLWNILRATIAGILQGAPLATTEARLGWFIVVGSIPAAVAGLTLADFFDDVFSTPVAAAAFLLVTAVLLVTGERLLSGQKKLAKMGWADAIIIGLFQMLALLPGISRSGSTIAAGLARGLNRATAARYSFLLGVPAILGAGLLATLDLLEAGNLAAQAPALLATFLTAAVSGYACIHFLLSWLRRRSLYPFAIYCAVLGSGYLVLTFLGVW